MAVARDKFWIFGCRAHDDDIWIGKNWENRRYQLRTSRITPAEAALMLDVPNVLMISSDADGQPAPYTWDAYGYMESFCRMDRVWWGGTGPKGYRIGNEEKFVRDLAEEYPNVCGIFLDDVFSILKQEDGEAKADKIFREGREILDGACRKIETYVTWYPLAEFDVGEELIRKYVDGLTIWTWHSDDLVGLEERYEKIEAKYPEKKKLLGIYLFDYEKGEPLTDEQMEFQCELGLRLMKEGRCDGLIFESNTLMGVKFPSEKWLRNWLEKVKYTEIPE